MQSMDVAELERAIARAPPRTLAALHRYLTAAGVADGTDLSAVRTDLLGVVYFMLHGTLPLPSADDRAARWRRYRDATPTVAMTDARWLNSGHGVATPELAARYDACRRAGYPIHLPGYVAPAAHAGVAIGLGLFALVPLRRGQFLCQFTGSLHKHSTAYVNSGTMRDDYVMNANAGVEQYIVNPLSPDETGVDPNHFAAYINEPSHPRWEVGEIARMGTRNVRVAAAAGDDYTVEFGTLSDVHVHGDALEPLPGASHHSEANVYWVDFPVPLTGLYVATGERRGEEYVMQRTPHAACELTWSIRDALKAFYAFSDGLGVYALSQTSADRLCVGQCLLLRDAVRGCAVYAGLERYAQIVATAKHTLCVRHVVAADWLWCLPVRALAGKLKVCARCRADDRATCGACTMVPFPTIHACADVPAGTELLCLYGSRIRRRGRPCRHGIGAVAPPWDHFDDVARETW